MKKPILFLFLAALFPVTLCGCRESPVLEKIVYQQDHEVDLENDSIDNNDTNGEQDENIPPQTQTDDSKSKQDQSKDDAVSGNEMNTADKTYDPEYQDNANENGQSKTSSSDTTNTEGGGTSGNGQNPESGGGPGPGNGEKPNPEPKPDDTKKQIVDYRGVTIDIPENVDSVTATGEAATIVEILGGSGRLIASSASFTGNSLARRAFSDVSSVAQWWDYDGSGVISASNFAALLEAAPEVCFEISGQNTFSETQISDLEEAGIKYVVLPPFSSLDNIKKAVALVGDMLGDRSAGGGTNAPAIASEYSQWADSVVNKVKDIGESKAALYISSWDESAYWEISNARDGVWQSGYGVAIAGNSSQIPLNDCIKLVNLTNAGSDNVYVNPLRNNYWLHTISNGTGTFFYGTNLTVNAAGKGLGNDTFPAVIVRDAAIKEKMQSDIHWGVYGWVKDEAGNEGFGLEDGMGHIIPSTIEGNYGIYVNPTGLGSWTDGSVEAPLEAAWLSCKFQGGCSMDELRGMVSDFYSTFYHLDVNTGDILGE